jgi:hypothetical protein
MRHLAAEEGCDAAGRNLSGPRAAGRAGQLRPGHAQQGDRRDSRAGCHGGPSRRKLACLRRVTVAESAGGLLPRTLASRAPAPASDSDIRACFDRVRGLLNARLGFMRLQQRVCASNAILTYWPGFIEFLDRGRQSASGK